ncbi:hypothetical protein [Lutibacter flavus]|uniref:Uncharacterized protein n=1 Tax=Lutibacter flavus TaxID=691689 RepID=A0A238Y618_9FLAO|nr:hypothetical protein [Lutibacter flavus]SNR66716.1 hypothetical protein SAMN04488111_2326 [Lutibacter flavus]
MKAQTQKFTNLKNSKVVNRILKNVLGLSIIAIFSSCVPDGGDIEIYEPQPNGTALNNRFENNRADAIEEFTLDAATGGIITGTQGTKVEFAANSFGISGSPVTGNVTVQLIEIYDKASIVFNNKSTLGERINGDKEALKSAGEFFINAKQGANELDLLTAAKVTSRNIDLADADFGMGLFTAGEDLNDTEDWVEAEEEVKINEADGSIGISVTYSFNLGNFGWSNLDRWYSFAGPKTQLFVDVPEGYNGDNCAVYLYYDNEDTAIARMDTWNEDEEMFTEHYGLIPIGLEVHIIMVAEIDGQLHYAMQGTTMVDNHIELISSLIPITQSELEVLINNLP